MPKKTSKNPPKKLTPEEISQWNELCDYVKYEIYNYSAEQKFPTQVYTMLKGIQEGNAVANRNIDEKSNYPFNVILMTFKAYKREIQYAFRTKDFKDDIQKMRYAATVVNSHINDIYERYLNAQKAKDNIKRIETDNLAKQVEYKPKNNPTPIKSKFEDLW